MTPLEFLVVILGIPFFFIEISQLIQLVRSQKKLTSIWERVLEDPEYAGKVVSNALFGFMEEVKNDKEKETIFFGFLQVCAVNGVEGVRAWMGESASAGVNLPKRHPAKPFEGIINQVLPGIFDNIVKKGAKKAEQAAEGALAEW